MPWTVAVHAPDGTVVTHQQVIELMLGHHSRFRHSMPLHLETFDEYVDIEIHADDRIIVTWEAHHDDIWERSRR